VSTSLLFVIVFSGELAKKKTYTESISKVQRENSLVFKDQLRFHYSRGRIEVGHRHIVVIAEPINWRLQSAKPSNVFL